MLKKRLIIPAGILLFLAILIPIFGSAPPSPLYFIKITRETIQTFFIFGDEDKAHWLLTRAEKRITEAEKLNSRKIRFLAGLQISKAKEYQTQTEILLADLKNKTNINYLVDKHTQIKDRIKALEE